MSLSVPLNGRASRPPNTGKIFAIGDIHGCSERLAALMERLPYDPARDTLVFLGDYIDRGAQSRDVIALVRRIKTQGRNVVTLFGNHEHMLLEYQRHDDEDLLPLFRAVGMEATLESYGAPDLAAVRGLGFLPPEHREFLETLLPYWETDDYLFVHAGLLPGIPLNEQSHETLCSIREPFLSTEHDFGKPVIFGHTPFGMPLVTATKIGIDTGAVYGNLLTAVELPSGRFYHA